MVWSIPDRVRLVQLYYQSGSATQARRTFMREGNRRQGPSVKTIVQLVSRFEESGSVAGKSYKRATTATTPTTIKQIARAISRNPRLSVRRLSKRTGIPPTTIHRILRKWLRLFPFKVQLTQKMKRGDKSSRIRQCKWLAAKLRSKSFAANLLMTDEANFTLDGVVNKQNCRIWGTEIPCASAVKEQYPPHVTVWCGVSKRAIIGPYFFEQSGRPATVTSARYRAMLETFLMPELTRLGIPSTSTWFQQDGARVHTTSSVLEFLHGAFGGRIISRGCSVPWPARSPDLSFPDFFLWGHIKDQVYKTPVTSIKALKRRIKKAIESVPQATLEALPHALLARCRACIRRRGSSAEATSRP